jgi:hypothetical protein
MDVSDTPALERIARVLAGQRLSANGEGSGHSVSGDVDDQWCDFLDDARAVLRTLREPDRDMAAAGDPAVWTRMVLAALGQDASVAARGS